MEKILVDIETKERIDKYLAQHTEYSRSLIKKMLTEECILLNGQVARSSMKVQNQDVIEFVKEIDFSTPIVGENIPLDIIYESPNVILINKPSSMVVHPGSGNKNKTLVNALLYYTKHLSDCNGEERPGIVHRIDKDTSGLILVAKNNKAHEILGEQFKKHEIKRKYLALVKGELKHNNITIDAPIGRDDINRKKMTVTDKNSKEAVTYVKVLKRYQGFTLIECILKTGRTHQIRVHMKYIGYPVYNDPLYGTEEIEGFGQFLHSSEIEFIEPITKEEIKESAPLPKIFQDFLLELEQKTNSES